MANKTSHGATLPRSIKAQSKRPAPTPRSLPETSSSLEQQKSQPANGNGHDVQTDKQAGKVDKKTEPKAKKVKLTSKLPKAEYAQLLNIREQFLKSGIRVKKSDLIRASIQLLSTVPIGRAKSQVAKIVELRVAGPATKN